MDNFTLLNKNGVFYADSRDVTNMIDKRHSDLLESINGYVIHLTNGNFRSSDFFVRDTYVDQKGEARPYYLLTRRGCDMVANKMTGEKGVLFTAAYVTKFEEMEKRLIAKHDSYTIEDPIERAKRWIEEAQERKQLADTIEEQKPKVIFADAVGESKGTILVADLAKILNQNGVEIGQNRLFKWLRDNGYLGKQHSHYNKPTQKAIEAELFTIKERPIFHNSGDITTSITPKVTGKGQRYFIDKFVELFGTKAI